LESYHKAYGLDYVAFRYFNACGADSQGRHGQESGATHIIARVLESMRDNQEFTLYGTDYSTDDGTCIRDYVHVEDIARAHVIALQNVPAGVYNLGSNQGTSNKEIVQSAMRITGKELILTLGNKRVGDPPLLTANANKFNSAVSTWQKYTLDDMITHAWAWYNVQ
jgi:UDP-glucose 4-epimerase